MTYLAGKGHCAIEGDVSRVLRFLLFTTTENAFCSQIIKFAPPLTTTQKQPISITESDASILNLLSTLETLSNYITSLESRMAAEQAQAVSYLSKKQPNMVKSHLIAKKRLEKVLEERVGSRDKLQEVVFGIERAKGDGEVSSVGADVSSGYLLTSPTLQTLEALSLGSSTLRTILASPTLQISNIEATTSALDESLIAANEINEAVDSVAALDEGMEMEVEDELRELQEKEKRIEEEEQKDREAERARKLLEAKAPTGLGEEKGEGVKAGEKPGEKEKEKLTAA